MKNIIGWIIGIAVIWFIFSAVGGIGKYEGETAEEWFNRYDIQQTRYQELHDCVEPYATAEGYIPADDLYYECF